MKRTVYAVFSGLDWVSLDEPGPEIPIPARLSTAQLAEDLIVDPEALKLETHEPGVFDENGDYIPQYSDDPRDLEHLVPNPLDAPEGDTAPESVEPASDSTESESTES